MSAAELRARRLIADALDVALEGVPLDASIDTLDRWDSLGHLRVVARIEEALGRPLEASEVLSVADLPSVAALIGG